MDQRDFFSEPTSKEFKTGSRIFIGTSGFVFPDWRGIFYPAKLPQNRWLEFYTQSFETLEINSTYYRLPSKSTFESMVKRTPEGYPLWVKIPGDVTHRDGDVVHWMELFQKAIAPINETGRLVGVLAQFPFSFRPTPAAMDRLSLIREHCAPIPCAVELRNSLWQTVQTVEFLHREAITYVIADLPALPNLPTPETIVTSAFAYLRFHGRNSRTWYNPDLGDRYDYEYSLEELAGWIPKILSLAGSAETTYIFFNNCHMGQAVKNARMLKLLLQNNLSTFV